MNVCHYQRRRRALANFSLEFVFLDIRSRLKERVKIDVREAPFHSNGIVRRLWICFDAWWHQSDITHVTGDISFAALALRKNSSVLTIPDCGFVKTSSRFRRAVFKKIWLDWPVSHVRVVTTISEVAKAEIVALTNCMPDKVVVIHVAISECFKPTPFDFNKECPRILFVGAALNKNLSRVAKACVGTACKLVIVGDIPASISQQLRDDKIQFENHVNLSQSELVRQYARADLLVFASTYEGFGMPILEAQAVGRPVVTSNISSMPEVAGDAACFVDPFNIESIRAGIQNVISDETYREELIVRGFENVKRFDPEKIANQYLELYRGI